MTTRDAGTDDVDLVAEIAAEGFYDDPVMSWVLPDDATRLGGLRIGFGELARSFLGEHSALLVVDDACVAMWRTPAFVPPPPSGEPSPYPDDVQERFRILGELMTINHPHEPHWYLNVLATRPDRRGQGLGAQGLQPVLDVCDAEGMPAYLESSNPRNMTLYRRHGFEDAGDEIRLPDGPSLYPMWRAAR